MKNIGQKIINAIKKEQNRRQKSRKDVYGEFYRAGGNQLLYDLPVTSDGLVIEGGSYKGGWTSEIAARYGCKIHVYEPVPQFAEYCQNYFKNNQLGTVHNAALGDSDGKRAFYLEGYGTSEFKGDRSLQYIEANVVDIAKVFANLGEARVACFALNIEGGEYEVLERMLEIKNISRCDCLLIQFHRHQESYEAQYQKIVSALKQTHNQSWCYKMIWEKWVIKSNRS